MSIDGTNESWGHVERLAQNHEADHFLPVAKVPVPSIEQQLLWATVRCAELQAKVIRLQTKANEALLWLTMGECERAKQEIAQCVLDL